MSDTSHPSLNLAVESPDPLAEVNSPADAVPVRRRREFVGRSPGQLAWLRLKRDRTALASAVTLVVAVCVALAAPAVEWLTGMDPTDKFVDQLNDFGMPIGYAGGISSDHLLGLE